MKTIHKFPIYIDLKEQRINMPGGAELLAFQVQNGKPTIWVLVNTNNPTTERRLFIFGTGDPVDFPPKWNATYFGTIQDGGLVWHLFDGGEMQ